LNKGASMSQAIRVQESICGNGSVISRAKNRLINASKYLPISNPSAAVSNPTQPPITGLDRHRLAAANENLEELIAAGRGLRQQWADAEHWRQLARERGYRLPHWYQTMTPKGMEQVLRGLGLDRQFYRDGFGLKTYQDLIDRNPDTPLWVFAGWCLELA
jgi:hypothetical protein